MNKIKEILQKIFLPNSYGWVLLLFTIILLPNIAGICLLSDLASSLTMKLAYAAFSLLILILPALFLRLRYYFLLEGLFVLLAPLEIAHMVLNKMPLTEGFITAIFNTNVGEASEMLLSLKGICIVTGLLWICYFFITFTKIRNNYLFAAPVNKAVIALFILFNLLLYGSMLRMAFQSTTVDKFDYANAHFIKKYKKIYPCDLLFVSYSAYTNKQAEKKMQEQLKSFSFNASRKDMPQREIYVVVIGESARYGNFSINGYNRPTSPLLEKTQGLLSYNDVYATANLTETVLPLLLTRATPLDPERGYKEKAFTDAFAECGFSTAWIANQSSQNPFIARIADDCDFSYFSTTDFDASINYDGNLLPYVDSVMKQNNPSQLIVLHTLGSHFRYNFRYPESFRHFTPAMEGTMSYSVLSPSNKDLLVNTYDNSVRYTDYILSQIIDKVEQQHAVSAVVYISDHAENLYDDQQQIVFHGGDRYSKFEIHVPMFVWTSPEYQTQYPQKQEALRNHTDKALSSGNLFHTLLDLADIHYPEEKPTASFASPLFREDSIRYLLMPDKRVIHFLKENRND